MGPLTARPALNPSGCPLRLPPGTRVPDSPPRFGVPHCPHSTPTGGPREAGPHPPPLALSGPALRPLNSSSWMRKPATTRCGYWTEKKGIESVGPGFHSLGQGPELGPPWWSLNQALGSSRHVVSLSPSNRRVHYHSEAGDRACAKRPIGALWSYMYACAVWPASSL